LNFARPFLRTLALGLVLWCSLSPPGARAAEGDLTLSCTVADDKVKLGDDIAVEVVLSNTTAKAIEVPALRLADDSLSIRLTGGGDPATLTRLYGAFVLKDGQPAFERKPTTLRSIAAGATVRARLTFPALRTGGLELRVTYGLGDTRLATESARVNVALRSPSSKKLEARIETGRGTFRVQLDGARAYGAAAQFWTLARQGFYDRLDVHRVVDRTLVQSGDPRGDGSGGPGWYLPGEGTSNDLPRGTLAFARGAHPDSAGSQWFIVTAEGKTFDPGFAPIGTVVEGIELLDALAQAPLRPGTERPLEPDQVKSVKIVGR
jgi:peptidyl-prolyl cis-trans isomerase B (cyclophilin B)